MERQGRSRLVRERVGVYMYWWGWEGVSVRVCAFASGGGRVCVWMCTFASGGGRVCVCEGVVHD